MQRHGKDLMYPPEYGKAILNDSYGVSSLSDSQVERSLWLHNHPFVYCHRRPGGDRIYNVFDNQLPAALRKLPFDRHLSLQNVRKVVSEADGYQPHLIAPEQGYRRLIEGALGYFRGPAEASVDAVSIYLVVLFCFFVIYFEAAINSLKLYFYGLDVGSLCLKRTCEEINSWNSGKAWGFILGQNSDTDIQFHRYFWCSSIRIGVLPM